ncbi:hypothetical protein CDD83_6779 [Cordyceps sp. RAO-2017]|nr:hypothetical protein CDD83_6779 [Cordyceps sp. RAO-2017]
MVFFFASQLRSVLSPQRPFDRPPFLRREHLVALASPFASPPRHDVTPSTTLPVARPPVAMTLCKFYQQGNCKFGNSCRFEHPARNHHQQQQQPPSQNRFGALSAGGGGGQDVPAKNNYNISAETIVKDLTTERPPWILSAYAPGRDAPDQLFGGYPREQSFEELRLHYMVGKASGNEQQALSQAQELYQNAQQQIDNVLRNVQDAARFVADGENRHPNRHDICREGTQGAPFNEFLAGRRPKPTDPFSSGAAAAPSPFGGGAQPGNSSFGQPSALGRQPNPFGAPAFGQPSQPASSFGQPSSQPVSSFGQPSALGPKPNPFGAPAFGQPAQPSAQSSAFGQPAQSSAQGSAFGQPAQSSAQGSAFGQPGRPNVQGSAFGQPSQLGQKSNPFASTSQPASNSSPFANSGGGAAPASNPFGTHSPGPPNAAPNPFAAGQTSNAPAAPTQPSANPFGQPSAPTANPFASAGQSQTQDAGSSFAHQTRPSTNGAFGQPARNPFGQGAAPNAPAFGAQPFGAPLSQPNPLGASQPQAASADPYPPGSARQHPPPESYISKAMDGRINTFKGKAVSYKDGRPGVRGFDGAWTRIWFPNGPPPYDKNTELPPQQYDDKSKAQWEAFAQSGAFADGIMPALPPPRVCTRWDF